MTESGDEAERSSQGSAVKKTLGWVGTTFAGIAALFFLYVGLVALNSSRGDSHGPPEAGSAAWIMVSVLAFIVMAIAVWVVLRRVRRGLHRRK